MQHWILQFGQNLIIAALMFLAFIWHPAGSYSRKWTQLRRARAVFSVGKQLLLVLITESFALMQSLKEAHVRGGQIGM